MRLAWIERDVDRIELHQRVQWRAGDADKGADRRLVPTEAPGERRADFRVAEVELGRPDGGLIHRQRGLGLLRGTGALVEGVLGEVAAFGKRRPAVEIGVRIVESGRVASRLRLRLIQRGLEVAWIDRVKEIAFLDVGAIWDVLLSDISRTPWPGGRCCESTPCAPNSPGRSGSLS